MGKVEHLIVQQVILSREELPDKIKNAPFLMDGLQLYMQAYYDLDSERVHSLGLTPIAWSKIKDYGFTFEFDEIQLATLFYVIRRMDNEHLKYLSKKQSNDTAISSS